MIATWDLKNRSLSKNDVELHLVTQRPKDSIDIGKAKNVLAYRGEVSQNLSWG